MSSVGSAWRRRGSVVLSFLISAACVVLIARQVDFREVMAGIREARPGPLAASLLTKAIGIGFLTWRSRLVLEPLGTYRPSTVLRSILLAFLGNTVLPLRAGEVLRVEYLAREGAVSRAGTLAVVVFERLLDTFWLLVMLAAVSPLVVTDWGRARALVIFALVVAAGLFVAALAGRFPDGVLALVRKLASVFGERAVAVIETRAEAFTRGLVTLRSFPRVLAVLGLSLGYWLASAAGVWLWLESFRLSLPWYAPFVILVFLAFGAAIPSSPGFIGTYDYFAMHGLSLFGVPAATAASFALVGHVVGIVPVSLVSLAVLFSTFRGLVARRLTVSRAERGEVQAALTPSRRSPPPQDPRG